MKIQIARGNNNSKKNRAAQQAERGRCVCVWQVSGGGHPGAGFMGRIKNVYALVSRRAQETHLPVPAMKDTYQ